MGADGDRPRHRLVAAGLLVAGSGCLGLSLVVPRGAVALVIASVLLAAGAVGAAWRAHRTERGASRGAGPVTAVVAFALAATTLGSAHWTTSSARFESAAAGATLARDAVHTVAAPAPRTEEFQVEDLTTDARLRPVVQQAAAVQPVAPAAAERRTEVAAQLEYSPRSGLEPDWAQAVAQDLDGLQAVTVPLVGSDLPMTSKIVYLASESGMHVVEMASGTTGPGNAEMAIWQDGTLVRNVVVTTDGADPSTNTVHDVGWSMKKFKTCLSDAGLVGVTVGLVAAACGVACAATAGAGCLICAAGVLGGNVGMVGTCAVVART